MCQPVKHEHPEHMRTQPKDTLTRTDVLTKTKIEGCWEALGLSVCLWFRS